MGKRALVLALGLAVGGAAACGAFGSADEPAVTPPADDAQADAPRLDGAAPGADAGPPDAPAQDAFVPPRCYVTDAGGPKPTVITIFPVDARAGRTNVLFDAFSDYGYISVDLKVCLEDGGMLPIASAGAVTGAMPPYAWHQKASSALPQGHMQAQFWGVAGSGANLPRGTADFVILPP